MFKPRYKGDLWSQWAGTDSRNNFFYNALTNIAHITGVPPHVRVGANSGDLTTYDDTVDVSLILV